MRSRTTLLSLVLMLILILTSAHLSHPAHASTNNQQDIVLGKRKY